MSDVGIWIFPQFMIQIQKVIAGLLFNRGLSSAGNIGIAVALDEFNHSIFSSAVPFKTPSSLVFGQYDSTPIDANMVVPMELYDDVYDFASMAF